MSAILPTIAIRRERIAGLQRAIAMLQGHIDRGTFVKGSPGEAAAKRMQARHMLVIDELERSITLPA